jgi:hypothetical protein
LSIVYLININGNKTTKFLYRNTASNEIFINTWLNKLFSDATEIYNQQQAYYESLKFPDFILKKLSFDKHNKYNISVKVIGFNS